jgi:hypothetical protein
MQDEFRTRNEFRPADRQEYAVGARGRSHASMKLCVPRVLDHDYIIRGLLEYLLECSSYGSRQYVRASNHH